FPFTTPPTTAFYPLSLHDALPISIYAEGQRRYMESLSSYAKRFVTQVTKPDVDFLFGLSPVISIEQKTVASNPRSTVGTLTDIRSEEHTSELQSRFDLVCRLLLEK